MSVGLFILFFSGFLYYSRILKHVPLLVTDLTMIPDHETASKTRIANSLNAGVDEN